MCEIGSVPAGLKIPVVILVMVGSARLGPLEASANATGQETDLAPDNNTTKLISRVIARADLSITLAGPSDYTVRGTRPNDTMPPYTVTVANAGTSAATQVEVTVTLAAGVIFEYAVGATCWPEANRVHCTLETLPVGQSHSFTLYVRMVSGVFGVLAQKATVGSAAEDPDMSDNTARASALVKYRLYIPLVSAGQEQ